MKKTLGFIALCCCTFGSYAQKKAANHWRVALAARGGKLMQNMTTVDLSENYQDAINVKQGIVKFENGNSYGADLQVSYFFGKKRHFGIGSGIMYLTQSGNIVLNNFEVTYKAIDANDDTYRQMLSTSRVVKEKVRSNNINIPVLLQYRRQLSKASGIALNAGILYNLKITYKYESNAAFNYEAAYKFVATETDVVTVYDNGTTPDAGDWLLTENAYNTSLNDGNAKAYFAALREQGYNVGVRELINERKGESEYKSGSIGFMIQPTYTYRLSTYTALHLGCYFMMQKFDNTKNNVGYKITHSVGSYNSLVNAVSKTNNLNYGISAGLELGL